MDTALLTVIGALLVALLASRSNAKIAADNRSWDQRSEMYLAIIRWLAEDLEALRAREPYRAAPLDQETRLLFTPSEATLSRGACWTMSAPAAVHCGTLSSHGGWLL